MSPHSHLEGIYSKANEMYAPSEALGGPSSVLARSYMLRNLQKETFCHIWGTSCSSTHFPFVPNFVCSSLGPTNPTSTFAVTQGTLHSSKQIDKDDSVPSEQRPRWILPFAPQSPQDDSVCGKKYVFVSLKTMYFFAPYLSVLLRSLNL